MPRVDREQDYRAHRTGLVMRLVCDELVTERDAEHWVAAWERHAASFGPARRLRIYWDEAWIWIAEGRALRSRPD